MGAVCTAHSSCCTSSAPHRHQQPSVPSARAACTHFSCVVRSVIVSLLFRSRAGGGHRRRHHGRSAGAARAGSGERQRKAACVYSPSMHGRRMAMASGAKVTDMPALMHVRLGLNRPQRLRPRVCRASVQEARLHAPCLAQKQRTTYSPSCIALPHCLPPSAPRPLPAPGLHPASPVDVPTPPMPPGSSLPHPPTHPQTLPPAHQRSHPRL